MTHALDRATDEGARFWAHEARAAIVRILDACDHHLRRHVWAEQRLTDPDTTRQFAGRTVQHEGDVDQTVRPPQCVSCVGKRDGTVVLLDDPTTRLAPRRIEFVLRFTRDFDAAEPDGARRRQLSLRRHSPDLPS